MYVIGFQVVRIRSGAASGRQITIRATSPVFLGTRMVASLTEVAACSGGVCVFTYIIQVFPSPGIIDLLRRGIILSCCLEADLVGGAARVERRWALQRSITWESSRVWS